MRISDFLKTNLQFVFCNFTCFLIFANCNQSVQLRFYCPFLCSMALLEWNGIAIDTIRLNKLTSELYGKKQSLQEEAWRVVGRQFNLLSVPEIRKVSASSEIYVTFYVDNNDQNKNTKYSYLRYDAETCNEWRSPSS